MRKTAAAQLALCGLLCALAIVIMLLGGVIPIATFCCPMLAALLLVPILRECGTRLAWAWYLAVAILSCLLGPDKEAAAIYVFLGYYPIIKMRIDRWKQPIRLLAKLLLFHLAIGMMYGLLLFVLQMDALRQELSALGTAMLLVLLLMGNATFFLFDALLPRAAMLYEALHRRKNR